MLLKYHLFYACHRTMCLQSKESKSMSKWVNNGDDCGPVLMRRLWQSAWGAKECESKSEKAVIVDTVSAYEALSTNLVQPDAAHV